MTWWQLLLCAGSHEVCRQLSAMGAV